MLKLKDIHKSYQQGSQEFPILKRIDLHVKEGDFLAIMGPTTRSEERRVGKECRSRWSPYH